MTMPGPLVLPIQGTSYSMDSNCETYLSALSSSSCQADLFDNMEKRDEIARVSRATEQKYGWRQVSKVREGVKCYCCKDKSTYKYT